MKKLMFLLVMMSSLGMSGCVVYDADAHANYDVDVRASWGVGNYYYDPHFGVYVSFGYPSSYWADGYYYHFSGSHWMRSNHWHGPWLTVAPKFVPTRVHGYRTRVYAHPERYPRVNIHPNSRYTRYNAQGKRHYHETDRRRDEGHNIRPNYRDADQSRGGHRQESHEARRDRQDSHKAHREAPKKIRKKQTRNESSEGNRRSYD